MFKAKINQFSSIQCKATHKWILIIILWAIKETTHSHPNIYSLIRIFKQWASWKITTKTVYVTKCPMKVKHSLAINFAVSLHLCSVLEKKTMTHGMATMYTQIRWAIWSHNVNSHRLLFFSGLFIESQADHDCVVRSRLLVGGFGKKALRKHRLRLNSKVYLVHNYVIIHIWDAKWIK